LRTLANAILDLAAFLELSDEETVDTRAALKALEWLAYSLQSASPEEIAALRAAVDERLVNEKHPARIAFLKSFPENLPPPQSGAV
jgi:hypothetical protein